MFEITTRSIRSVTNQIPVTEQPNRVSRWWMRHYRHIGLASVGSSAILVCIIAVILLPIAFKNPVKDEQLCQTVDGSFTKPTMTITSSSVISVTTTENINLSTSTQTDLLCAANATWKRQGVTVVGSSSQANLNDPHDILIDTDGNLFIADSGNNRVLYWLVNTTQECTVAGTGAFGSWINLLKYPAAIVVCKGQLYVSDLGNYRVLAFPFSTTEGSPDGITLVGRYGSGSALNQINFVYYIAVDSVREFFYLSDYINNRLLNLNLTDNTLNLVVGGNEIAGSDNISLNLPLGITVDETTGSLYVSDSQNHRVQKFDFGSIQGITIAGGLGYGQNLSQLYLPSAVAIDPGGNVYVADGGNNRIVQWLLNASQGRIIAGTGVAGSSDTQLNYPVQLKFDIHHNLYVVDQKNNRIQRFDLLNNGC